MTSPPSGAAAGPDDLARLLLDRSATGIATGLAELIVRGEILPGTALPPVRALATALRVSPATVSQAWQRLRARGMISGRGRAGTVVSSAEPSPRPLRFSHEGFFGGNMRHDLRLAVPDVSLLPDLPAVLSTMPPVDGLNHYERTPIIPALEQQARRTWPYPARGLMAANGGYEALLHVLGTVIQSGDRVLVEDPATPRILDVIERVGGRPTFVDCDAEGPLVAATMEALDQRPAAIVLQPGMGNPTGRQFSAARSAELGAALRHHLARGWQLLVVEDDGLGALHAGPVHSLVGAGLPGVHIRSYSKSHGPDLRLAVVEGEQPLVERIHSFRSYGAGWTSRILQGALAQMLADPSTDAVVERAAEVYLGRRTALLSAMAAAGHPIDAQQGLLDLWLPVADEQSAMVALAAHGVAALGGSRFSRPGAPPHLRIATSLLDAEAVPDVVRALSEDAVLV